MNDAPRRWWNRIDASLRKYGMTPTRADRCVYVYYDNNTHSEGKHSSKSDPLMRRSSNEPHPLETDYSDLIENFMNTMLDPVTGSPSKGRQAIGVVVLHVDDLFITGSPKFWKNIGEQLKKEYQIGSEDRRCCVHGTEG
jgi:hypothetical protein